MQRLSVIALALALTSVAHVMSQTHGRTVKISLVCLLWSAVTWSHWEARRFVARGNLGREASAEANQRLELFNATLLRYAFFQHATTPHYYSHGYVDPVLIPRLLGSDGLTAPVSNLSAVKQQPPETTQVLTGQIDAAASVRLRPIMTLRPGVRHYLSIDWHGAAPDIKGTLSTYSNTLVRRYWLPDSGFGQNFATSNQSFGIGGAHTTGFSVWTSNPEPEMLELRFDFLPTPAVKPPSAFMTVEDRVYSPESLPIRVHSQTPFRASTRSPADGLILETPRVFIEGYAARVNGVEVELVRTPDHLVGITLPEGFAEVELTYRGSSLLRTTYGIAWVGWIILITVTFIRWVRRLRVASAPPAVR